MESQQDEQVKMFKRKLGSEKENKKEYCVCLDKMYEWIDNKIEIKKWMFIMYDIIGMIISVSDVTTDVIILYQFYNNQYFIYFYISIIVLIIAQMAYVIVFIIRFTHFSQSYNTTPLFLLFFFSLFFFCLSRTRQTQQQTRI